MDAQIPGPDVCHSVIQSECLALPDKTAPYLDCLLPHCPPTTTASLIYDTDPSPETQQQPAPEARDDHLACCYPTSPYPPHRAGPSWTISTSGESTFHYPPATAFEEVGKRPRTIVEEQNCPISSALPTDLHAFPTTKTPVLDRYLLDNDVFQSIHNLHHAMTWFPSPDVTFTADDLIG